MMCIVQSRPHDSMARCSLLTQQQCFTIIKYTIHDYFKPCRSGIHSPLRRRSDTLLSRRPILRRCLLRRPLTRSLLRSGTTALSIIIITIQHIRSFHKLSLSPQSLLNQSMIVLHSTTSIWHVGGIDLSGVLSGIAVIIHPFHFSHGFGAASSGVGGFAAAFAASPV